MGVDLTFSFMYEVNRQTTHYQAVQTVLNDPAPSKELKTSLCLFSEAVSNRDFGLYLAEKSADGSIFERRLSPEYGNSIKKRTDLEKQNLELKRAFNTALEAGIVALFCRWPETVEYFNYVAGEIAADERKEMQLSQKAESFFDNDKNNGTPAQPFLPA